MVTNLQIKFIKSLQVKKYRYEHQRYLCEGEKIVEETIQYQPEFIDIIYADESWYTKSDVSHLRIERVSKKDLEKMSSLSTAPSVMALMKFREKIEIEIKENLSIFLDQISDPGNLGTIIRSCDWFGLSQIFLSPNCADVYNSKVIQSAMGSHFRVHCHEIEFEDLIQNHKFDHIFATAMKGRDISSISNPKNALIVMGSESHGVSDKIMIRCTEKITIPAFGQTESLNVSVATGIILYQMTNKLD